MTEPMSLRHLIDQVDDGGGDELAKLDRAEEFARKLQHLGDRLIGYFVDEARAAGHSWADIGRRLNISRQAAQQRYTPRSAMLTIDDLKFVQYATERTRNTLRRAEDLARQHRHTYVGSEHLLLAILTETQCLAVKILIDLGAPVDTLAQSLSDQIQDGATDTTGPLPLSPQGRSALDASIGEALELGHNYLGTEHILIGLFRGGLATTVLTDAGLTQDQVRAATVEQLNALLRNRA